MRIQSMGDLGVPKSQAARDWGESPAPYESLSVAPSNEIALPACQIKTQDDGNLSNGGIALLRKATECVFPQI